MGLGRACISVIICWIGSRTCCIGDGPLTPVWNSPKSQYLMMISPNLLWSLSFSSSILPSPKNTKLSHCSLSLHAMIKTEHRVQHTPSTAYTEYSIHRVQQTMSTAYTAYCVIPRSTVSCSQPVSHLLADHVCTQFSTFPQLWVNQWIESQLPLRLPPELPSPDWPPPDWPPLDWPPPSTPPISLDHGLQVHLRTRSIAASKSISKLARLLPPSASLNLLDYGLQVHHPIRSITVSKWISNLAWIWPPCSHHHCLQVHLQICSIRASKCISKLVRLRPPGSHDQGLQVHPQTRSLTASKYILKERRRVYWDTGVTEVDRVTGSIYSADPGVDRHHLISISIYHKMRIHTLSFPTFGLSCSVRAVLWSHTIA